MKSKDEKRLIRLAQTESKQQALFVLGQQDCQEMLCRLVNTGLLNPEWLEWFMGWPMGWTGLEPLEMDKYQEWLQSHGGC